MNESNSSRQGRGWATTVAAVGACLIFAMLVWEMKKYTLPAPAVDEARKVERADALKKLHEEEAIALNTVGWVDPAKGIVRLPIIEAMKLTEHEWQNPAQARSNLIVRVDKAFALPPKQPEKPSEFE